MKLSSIIKSTIFTSLILVFILNNKLHAQSPGNVSSTLELWLKADAGTTTSGADVSAWNDQSGNTNNMSNGTGILQPDLIANSLNFNPVIEFDGVDDRLGGAAVLAGGDDSFTMIAVWETYTSAWSIVMEQNGAGASGSRAALFTLNQAAPNYGFNGVNNDAHDILSYSTNIPQISSIILDGTNTVTGAHNGNIATGTIDISLQNIGTNAFVLGRNDLGNNDYLDGTIAEVIVYSSNISATDRQKIESYLAIKYGITLDQSTAQDYTASDGTTEMWDKDATDASTYDNDIAGIGRDDNSALGQVISKSINANAILTIEAEGEGTNAANSFTDIADNEFLTWGNNDGAATWTSTDAPGQYQILSKEWSVQETGDVGTVEVSFDVADADFDVPALVSSDSYYIVIDTDNDGNFTDETPVAMYDDGTNGDDVASDNIWTAQGIDFDNGEDFTLATLATAPGNITGNLEMWLKADAGVNVSGSDVTSWADQAQNFDMSHGITANQPDLLSNSLNFNPVIEFDGVDDWLFGTAVLAGGDDSFTMIAVWETDVSAWSVVMEQYGGGAIGSRAALFTLNQAAPNYGFNGVNNDAHDILSYSTNIPQISSIVLDGTNTVTGYHNGNAATGTIDIALQNIGTNSYVIGRNENGTNDYFDGTIAEVLVYSSNLIPADRQKIESYLAIKYGISIDQTSATNYLSSDNTTVWDATANATYNTDIAGIARDDDSGLDQRKSSSVNANEIITIAHGSISSPTAFTADNSWLIWGSDNAVLTFTQSIDNTISGTSNRMARVWHVDETGTVGSVEISFPNSNASQRIALVVHSSDPTFPNDVNRSIYEMENDGTDYKVTVDFSDGDYFSFAEGSVKGLPSVLISEVITDPQLDWSSGNFYDANPSVGTPDAGDDWIELYILENNLNLTGWTIEINDGTNVADDLTSSGVFSISNYLSLTGGSFTATDSGDYLILGTMNSGAMNQSVNVILKDANSNIIDQVEIYTTRGTGFTGNANDLTDESVSRLINTTDSNIDADDFVQTRATLGTSNSPTGTVKINEVVTDPFTDWGTNGFDGTDGLGTVSAVDEWIELYIGTAGLNLTGWTIQMDDGSVETDELTTGAGTVSYVSSGSGSITNTEVGDYLVLGNPTGSMNNNVLLILSDAAGTEIDRVQLGGAAGQAPSGANSSTSAESIARYTNTTDTDTDDADFIQTISTLGANNSVTGTVLINEVVTSPQQDWSTNGFDGTIAGSTISAVDAWLELYIGTAGINLTGWTIELTDNTPTSGDLTSTGAFDVSNYISNTSGSSFFNTAVGDYLVLGNVDGTGTMENSILITLKDAFGTTIDEIELGDDLAGDGAGDGAPDGSANGGLATNTSDESISRIPNATDTDNDVNDFSALPASMGSANSTLAQAAIGNALDFDGTNDFVVITNNTASDLNSGAFTVEFWANITSASCFPLAKGTGGIGNEYFFEIDVSGLIRFGVHTTGDVLQSSGYSTTDIRSAWHHITGVLTATDVYIYVDGVLESQTAWAGTLKTDQGDLFIGQQSTGNFATGTIDELRIWDDIRTHQEVLENINLTLDGSETNLVAYYSFDQSSGTNLPDIIDGSSNDGTLTNMDNADWVAAAWNTFTQNASIFQSGGIDTSPVTSGELTLSDISFLNDDNDILLIGHDNGSFTETTTDLPASTLLTARYGKIWHITKNDAAGTSDGNVTFSFDLGAIPSTDTSYYLLERVGTSGDFSIVPAVGINPSGNSIVFTVNTFQLDNGSYYTLGRSDSGVGNALDFDGTNDYVSITNAPLTAQDNITMEMWVNPTAFAGTSYALYNGTIATDGYGISFDASGNIGITTGNDGSVVSTTALPTSIWSHIAIIRNAGTWEIYVNGVAVSIIFTQLPDAPTGGAAIGSDDLGAQLFDGMIDEVSIWDDVRTQTEIINNMYASLAGDEANLVAYYRMNQGIGNNDTNLPDLSGDNNNGTLTNFDNLNAATAASNYITSTRNTFANTTFIVNGGLLSAASDELTLTSSQTAGDFLQDAGDQIIWSNDGADFTETTSDIPTGTVITNRINKTWNINKNDAIGTADGDITFSFDLAAIPSIDYTYFLLTRAGTSGDFSVVNIIDSRPNGNSIEFTIDGAELTDGNYFTLGRSDSGAGNAVDLDGTDDFVNLGNVGIVGGTVELWLNANDVNDDRRIYSQASGVSTNAGALGIDPVNTTNFGIFVWDGSAWQLLVDVGSDWSGSWHHLAVVYSGGNATAYWDGVAQMTQTSAFDFSGVNFGLGSDFSASDLGDNFNGQMDELRIWTDARTPSEIVDNMHTNIAGTEANIARYYRFNQGINAGANAGLTSVIDRRGNGIAATLSNLALTGASSNWVASNALVLDENSSQALKGPGNALDFDGIDDYVLIPDDASLDITGTLTLEAYINLTTTPPTANEGIVSKFLTAGNQKSYTLDINTSGNIEFIISGDGSTNTTLASTSTVATSEWTHIAVVYNPSTSMQVYINGTLNSESTSSIPAAIFSSSAEMWIGLSSVINADNAINGVIDEIRVWNTARTATQIQNNMFEVLLGDEVGLAAYYKFDEVANSTSLPDESTNSNTGTLTNMDAATDWVLATAREPFKTITAGNWNSTSTWKSGTIPNTTSSILNIEHDITLDANLTADIININTGVTVTLNTGQSIIINGDMINNGTITGDGIISFEGSTAQNISGGTYSNITLNNTVDEISLTGNVTLSGVLTLTNGNFTLGTHNLVISTGGSISGASASSYIQTLNQNSSGGHLQMEVANGAGNVTFPVGTTTYTPFSLLNLGTTGDFNLRVFDDVFENGTSGTSLASTEEINRTWAVNALGSDYNTTFTIQWNAADEDGSFDRANMYLSKNGSGGYWRRLTTGTFAASGANPYTASASGVTSYSEIGGGSGGSPLPVSLTYFNANLEHQQVALSWQTASEFNNDKFIVEKSTDGSTFLAIGEVLGNGNSNDIIDYNFMDSQPVNDINYYRLKQVDYDGGFEYSKIASIHFKINKRQLVIYPNPFTDDITIQFDKELKGNSSVTLYDLSGNMLLSKYYEKGLDTFIISPNELKRGMYLLQIQTNKQKFIRKVVKD